MTSHVEKRKKLFSKCTSHVTLKSNLSAGRHSPGSTISSREVFCLKTENTLTLGGFGQPTKGACAELHTRDQRVRLLAYSNLQKG